MYSGDSHTQQLEKLQIKEGKHRTYVVVIAIHREESRNTINRIPCRRGIPLNGYVYDAKDDSYHVDCSDYFYLGYIPISFILSVENTSWHKEIPVHENVLKQFLTEQQKFDLKTFLDQFNPENYIIEYMQMIDSNYV